MSRMDIASIVALSPLVRVGCEADMDSDYSPASARGIDAYIRATRINAPTTLRSLDRRR